MPVIIDGRDRSLELFNAANWGARGDGTTDDTSALQAALDAAGSAGGGVVWLPPGTYLHSGLDIPARVTLEGAGSYASVLTLADSSNANCITFHQSSDAGVTDRNAQYAAVRNLRIDGNKANQTSGHGIVHSPDPAWPASKPAADLEFDSFNIVENVTIENVKQDGIVNAGRSECRYRNVYVYAADRYGFNIASDTWLDSCTSGLSGLFGFYIVGASVRAVNCKAFYAGNVTGSSGDGFRVESVSNGGVALVACEAQDNKANGFVLVSSTGVILQGCFADSNSVTSPGTYVGVDLWAVTNSIIDVICCDRNVASTTNQRIALQVRSSSTQNRIRFQHNAHNGASLTRPITSGSTLTGNAIEYYGTGAQQAPSYAASYTPDPLAGSTIRMTLTGNITVNSTGTSWLYPGAKLRFIFTQDGTGGRTVTWNAIYKTNWSPTTTAGKVNTIDFEFDGTNWVQVASATNL